MHKIKIIFLSLAGLIVLLIALIAIAFFVFDDEDYQKIVVAAVERYTGYRVIIESDFDLDLSTEPSLSASNIRFEADPDGPQPPISHIGHIYIKLAAQHLFTGTIWIRQLMVEDVTFLFTVGQDRKTETLGPQSKESVQKTAIPVFESISLRNIIVDVSDIDKGHLFQAKLKDFKLKEDPDNALRYAEGDGIIDVYDFKIHGRLGAVKQIFDLAKPYPVELNFESHGGIFKVSGGVDDPVNGEGYALHVLGEAADLSNFLKLFQVELPGLGRLKFATDIAGNLEKLRATDIDVTISQGSQVELEAKGSINDLAHGKGIDVAITCSSKSNDFIRMLLPDILSDFSSLELDGRLRDRQGDYVLEDITAHGSNNEDLALNAEGVLNFGSFVDDPVVRELDLSLQAFSPTTEDAKRFLVEMLPELGPVTGKARLNGPIDRLSLEDLTLAINESGPLEVKSRGRIAWIPIDDNPVSGIDLVLSLKAEQTQLLSSAFEIAMPELGSVAIKSRLLYSDDQLNFNEIDVQTYHAQGLNVSLLGSVAMNLDETRKDPGNIDVRIKIKAPDMGAAEPLLGARIFSKLGPVRGEARISGDTRILSFEDLAVTVGQPGDVIVTWQGRIGQSQLFGDHLISDVDIVGSIMADEVAKFASFADISIPDLGPLKGTWRLVNCRGNYCIDDWEWVVGDADNFQFKTTGKIDSILRKGSVSMDGIDFDVKAIAPSVGAVPFMADLGLPDLGTMQLKARMTGKEGRIDIGTCTLCAGPKEKPKFSMKGEILNIQSLEKTQINARFETMMAPWFEKLMGRSVSEDQKIFGALRLAGLADQFQIKQLNIETKDPDHLSLQTNGIVKKINQIFETNLKVAANSKDPSAAGSIFGIPLPNFSPLSIRGKIKSKGGRTEFNGSTDFGKTHLETIISHSTTGNQRPIVIVKNRSENVYLSDLGLYPKEVKDEATPVKKSKAEPDRIFSETPLPSDVLKSLNISLSMDADKLIGKDFVLSNLDFDLVLKDGLLNISPARLSYSEGDFSFESIVDTTGEKPEIMLKATCEDLDMDALLAHAHRPLILGGNLNLALDLRSTGNSFHEIASSLNGEIGYAIENGKIKRDVEMLTSDAIDLLVALPRIRDYQTLNCMTLRFIFEDGVGKSEIIFFDTPNVRTRGGATVDLASETLDMVLQPRPKKGLAGTSSAIRIQGPLHNPSVRKMPFREAARLYGEIFMPYVFLPVRGLGYLWYLMKNDKEEPSPCLNLAPQTE